MGRLDDAAKCLAIALLNYADDEGYFLADPILVRNACRPFDEDSRNATVRLRELSSAGWIEVREAKEMGFVGRIVNFRSHQSINHPRPSPLKKYFDSGNTTVMLPESYHQEWNGKERNRRGRGEEEEMQEGKPNPAEQSSTDLVPVSTAIARKDHLPEAMVPTFEAAKAAFESSEKAKAMMYQDHNSAAREVKALKLLVRRAHKLSPDNPAAFLAQAMGNYRDLVNGKLKGKAAWIPTGMVTGWIWSLILEGMQHEQTADEREALEAVKGLFAKAAS